MPHTSTLAARPPQARTYERTYRLRMEDVTPAMDVRHDAIARLLQNIAMDMIDESAWGKKNPFWIVRRNVIDVLEPITWPGDVHIERWCEATSSRWVGMRQRLTGVPSATGFADADRPAGLIETSSFCINVTREGRPSRIDDETIDDWNGDVTETRLKWKSMTPASPDAVTDAPEYTSFALRTTDFDAYGHMNNVAYWHAVHAVLARFPGLAAAPHRAVIEYLRPITPRDEATIATADYDGGLALWFIVDDVVTTSVTVTPL
ncbi:acyl-ACP thioesterase domain-containing protein [Gordonia liuliyuniae]|uniref:Thioesterase n=1 Tax=Gordonia liuliyuniae TaxID=2911517 RepID=A0ABS9IRH6_9ACTN|nr:acyl-ACP thioesterase domain-containing protein [Gordonia liuliyuniae]MCF8588163.1 thioesterase [Gordonia liuliyuniae]